MELDHNGKSLLSPKEEAYLLDISFEFSFFSLLFRYFIEHFYSRKKKRKKTVFTIFFLSSLQT